MASLTSLETAAGSKAGLQMQHISPVTYKDFADELPGLD